MVATTVIFQSYMFKNVDMINRGGVKKLFLRPKQTKPLQALKETDGMEESLEIRKTFQGGRKECFLFPARLIRKVQDHFKTFHLNPLKFVENSGMVVSIPKKVFCRF